MPNDRQDANGPTLRLGISTCLLGENVRYDAGHKLNRYLVHELGPYVEWVPVCPEVECGLPTPRESMRLEGDPESPRLIAPKSGTDHTPRMTAWIEGKLAELAAARLHGFVFKSGSPSSGAFRVKVYDDHGMPSRQGAGLFAKAVMDRFPALPVEEEGRLNDARLRENFIDRLFVNARWDELLDTNPSPGGLVDFHSGLKLTVMAHSPEAYRQLGRWVADAGKRPWEELAATYHRQLMEGLRELATPGRHANVLQHLMGFLKDNLEDADKAELLGLIEDYRQGLVPLIVPVTLLKHHLLRHPMPEWVHRQVYLNPYPKELMLRNHV